MQHRILGFDIARAYAILGMFIVNFNFSFGSILGPHDAVGRFLSLFTGNSTAIFIISAGMGLSLMANNTDNSEEQKKALTSKITKRSWFLFALGLLLYNWWSGDILHFYGSYMHIAAFLLFVPKRYYLMGAVATIALYHLLLFIIPVDTSWDFERYYYQDFWTPIGFLRNTLYNGWNSFFPWFSYFLVGMWLGRLDWQKAFTQQAVFIVGFILFSVIQILRLFAKYHFFNPFWSDYIQAEYFPPYLPFVIVTTGFALMIISLCMFLGKRFSSNSVLLALQKTGQMTLSHYVIHLTLGMCLMALLTGKNYTGLLEDEQATAAIYILLFACGFFISSVVFSVIWSKRFKNGPLETLMRKIAG